MDTLILGRQLTKRAQSCGVNVPEFIAFAVDPATYLLVRAGKTLVFCKGNIFVVEFNLASHFAAEVIETTELVA